MIKLETILKAKHICIETKSDSFTLASALYTYILTLHKKVSIVSVDEVDINLSFLPWFEKLRSITPSSADAIVEIDFNVQELYQFFKINSIKINKKMATSLYASLLREHRSFQKSDVDGMVFALAKELIELGAEYQLCYISLNRRVGLYEFRLKAVLFNNFVLTKNASCVEVTISDNELQLTGAKLSDVYLILEEFFTLQNVQEVILIKSDEEDKILINLKES